jgi:spore coat protein H
VKIDLDRHAPSRVLDGLKMLNFNCGVTDASQCREALSYAFFRAAGVPAPRTAYAELTLTVPGKYDKELVGLYTVVEQVDKGFLARHFGGGKGMLLKPEGLGGGVSHLGDDWKAYRDRYRPKSEPTEAQKKRLIEFAALVDKADDAAFRKKIGSYLDVDAFLRFVAANALLVNLDSYLGFGHNYYLYLVPKTNRFVFIPWDLDLSLAAWPLAGPPERQWSRA